MKTSNEILNDSVFIIGDQTILEPLGPIDNIQKGKYKITVSLKNEPDNMKSSIFLNTEIFPYYFVEDDDVIVFLKYFGDNVQETVPWCSEKMVLHPFTYSYNNTIEELIFPEGMSVI